MANYGGFYKGEKKKQKKERQEVLAQKAQPSEAVFTPPLIVPKGKNKNV